MCQLFPFVASRVAKPQKKRLVDKETGEIIKDPKIDGRLFLQQWKEQVQHENVHQEEEGTEEGWAEMKARAEEGFMAEEAPGKKPTATA